MDRRSSLDPGQIATESPIRLFARLFAWLEGVFGLLSFLLWLQSGNPEVWVRLLGLGATMSIVFGICQILVRRSGVSGVVRTSQSVSLTIPTSVYEAAAVSREALSRMGAKDVKAADGPTLTARMPMSWRSFGEAIGIQMRPVGPGVVEVGMSSHPRIRTTLVDYGKNLDNIEAFLEAIDIATRTPSSKA